MGATKASTWRARRIRTKRAVSKRGLWDVGLPLAVLTALVTGAGLMALGVPTLIALMVASFLAFAVLAFRSHSARPENEGAFSQGQVVFARYAPVVFLVALLLTLAALWVRSERSGTVDATSASAGTVAPVGFAEMCVALWLESGGEANRTAGFREACDPGVQADAFLDASSRKLRASNVATYSSLEDGPGYWSVLLAARVEGLEKSGEWRSLGVHYYRAAVLETDGRFALRGLPREVAAPLPDPDDPATQPTDFAVPLAPAQPDDPKTHAIQEYLSRYMIAPPESNPGKGDPGNYLAPSNEPPRVVHSPWVKQVLVTHTAFEPVEGDPDPSNPSRVNAFAQMTVTYGDSKGRVTERVVQQVPFTLVRQGASQWLIADTPSVPMLKEEVGGVPDA
jgi:hypothetical protein